jgi:hypothetical protein
VNKLNFNLICNFVNEKLNFIRFKLSTNVAESVEKNQKIIQGLNIKKEHKKILRFEEEFCLNIELKNLYLHLEMMKEKSEKVQNWPNL